MGDKIKNLSHSAVHFISKTPDLLANWYQDKLGFEITFSWGDPVEYVVTKREDISIHFVKTDLEDIQPRSMYIFCYDVDTIYSELKAKHISNLQEIADQDYQMRDFDVADPEGNRITFGTSMERITPGFG